MNIDPRIIGVLIDFGRAVWSAVANNDNKDDALAIAKAALLAGVEEAKRRAEELGVIVATAQLDIAAQRVLEAMHKAEQSPTISIPSLLDITEVGPDEKLTETTVAEIDLPEPEGSSNR